MENEKGAIADAVAPFLLWVVTTDCHRLPISHHFGDDFLMVAKVRIKNEQTKHFRPNPYYLPYIWMKNDEFLSKSILFTPHSDKKRRWLPGIATGPRASAEADQTTPPSGHPSRSACRLLPEGRKNSGGEVAAHKKNFKILQLWNSFRNFAGTT